MSDPSHPPLPRITGTIWSQLDEMLKVPWSPLEQGMVLGNFVLFEEVGKGGYAFVWRARDLLGPREVAIKIFRTTRFPEPEWRKQAAVRFVAGARAMRDLEGEGTIVQILEGPHIQGPYLWFAMALADGGNLEQAIRTGNLTTVHKVQIVDDLIRSIEAAHEHGVAHRDIRPTNVLIATEAKGSKRAVLADFDLAYLDVVLAERMSTTGVLNDTRYVPPEILAASADQFKVAYREKKNDIYAVAVVVFDLFVQSGEPIPIARDAQAILKVIPTKEDSGAAVSGRVRRAAAMFCARGFHQDPQQRFKTIGEARSFWQKLVIANHGVAWLAPAFMTTGLLNSLMVLDWAWGTYATQSLPMAAVAVGSGTASIGFGAIALAWIKSGARLAFPKWKQVVAGTLLRFPRLSWVLLAVSVVTIPSIGALTELSDRMITYWVVGAKDCVAQSGSFPARVIWTNDPTSIRLPGASRSLICPKNSPTLVTPKSWAATQMRPAFNDETKVSKRGAEAGEHATIIREPELKRGPRVENVDLSDARSKLVANFSIALSADNIASILKKRLRDVKRCFDINNAVDSDVETRIIIDANGVASGSTVRQNSSLAKQPKVAMCVTAAVARWIFESPGREVTIDCKFLYRRRR